MLLTTAVEVTIENIRLLEGTYSGNRYIKISDNWKVILNSFKKRNGINKD
jgi:hypothetical protein